MIASTAERSTFDKISTPRKRRNRDTPRRVADVLADELARAGVEVVFGMPGGTIAPLYDALLDHPQIRVVITRHENHAVFAAAGYAQTTGKLGVVIVTGGPGILNTINGLASAQTDGLPILVLAGEVGRKRFGHGALQEGSHYASDVVGIISRVSKTACELIDANGAAANLRRAIESATSGRRGVSFISLPVDLLGSQIIRPTLELSTANTPAMPPGALAGVSRALSGPGRKLILAGSGSRWGQTPDLLRQLAERLGCPVMTTPKAKGVFPESHPLSLGVFGISGHASAREYLASGVDVLLVVGSGLGEVASDGWSDNVKARRTFIQIDVDAAQLGRNFPVDVGICAPAETTLRQLLADLPVCAVADQHERFGVRLDAEPCELATGTEGRVSAPRALWELQQILPPDAIYTMDSGSNLFFATHYLQIDRPDSFVVLFGLASMGTSLALALGAQLGHPQRRVVAVCGDGGFHMAASELATAAALELPIIIVVLNDERLGLVEVGNVALYGRTPMYSTSPLVIAELAAANGADCVVVRQPNDILNATGQITAPRTQPLVLDVHIDRSIPTPAGKRIAMLRAQIKPAQLN